MMYMSGLRAMFSMAPAFRRGNPTSARTSSARPRMERSARWSPASDSRRLRTRPDGDELGGRPHPSGAVSRLPRM
jgi:hypothetical protein